MVVWIFDEDTKEKKKLLDIAVVVCVEIIVRKRCFCGDVLTIVVISSLLMKFAFYHFIYLNAKICYLIRLTHGRGKTSAQKWISRTWTHALDIFELFYLLSRSLDTTDFLRLFIFLLFTSDLFSLCCCCWCESAITLLFNLQTNCFISILF